MTLATRCPQCGTTFRVVSDQLKLRRGLVKCGRCQTVFNGVEKLHYIADEEVRQTTVIGAPAAAPVAAPPAPLASPAPLAPPAPPVAAPAFVVPPADAPMIDPLRPDLPPFAPPQPLPVLEATQPPSLATPAVDARSAVEPDASLDLLRDDQPPRRVLPDNRTPFPQISSDLLNPRGRGNPFASGPPASPLPVPTPAPLPAPVIAPGNAAANAPPNAPPNAPASEAFAPLADAPPATFVHDTTESTEPVDGEPTEATTEPPPSASDQSHDTPPDVEHHVGAAIPAVAGTSDEFDDGTARPPAPVDEAFVRATQARTHSPNLRNIFESEHGLDDLDEVDVETSGVLPNQQRGQPVNEADLGPLTLLDVASERDVPQFLREPPRRSLAVRLALACGCVLALAGLLAQGAWVYRAELANDYPVLQPTLAAACTLIGPDCRIGLPRRIAALRVVSAELQATPQSGDKRYLLRFGLGNDSARVQAWPDLELMLTDARNQQVVRRVITPDDYLGPGRTTVEMHRRIDVGLAPHAEESLSIPVRVDLPEPVYGYALGIFHP